MLNCWSPLTDAEFSAKSPSREVDLEVVGLIHMCYTSFMGGGWMFKGRLFMYQVVVSGHSGAVLCIMCSTLARSKGTRLVRYSPLLIQTATMSDWCHCLLFGCHITPSDMAPGNQWGQLIQLVMWHYLNILTVAVQHMGRQRWVTAIGDGGWKWWSEGGGEGGCHGWWQDGGGGKRALWIVDAANWALSFANAQSLATFLNSCKVGMYSVSYQI